VSLDDVNGTRDRRDEPVSELVKDLSREVSTLVHQEIALAKAEMAEKGKKAGIGAGMLGGAGVFALAVVGGSMATIILIRANKKPRKEKRESSDSRVTGA